MCGVRRDTPSPDLVFLTAAGRAALPPVLGKAPAAAALYARLADSSAGLAAADIAQLDAHQKRVLRGWRARGWVDARVAEVRPDAARHANLNAAQRASVAAILGARGAFATLLLYGVTGSGKTDVYLAAAADVIASGGQVLLLVPEINLTPQLMQRVRTALPHVRIATLHSALAAGARRAEWQAAASGEAQLVLGTRLAVFAPLPRLGLVIVDEEHDTSYKQQDNVRYHARDVAVWRAQRRDVPVVLGSATPSLESGQHAQAGRYRRLDLPERADPRAALPTIRLTANRAARALEGIGGVAARSHRAAVGARRAVARVREPARLCALAHLRLLPLGGAMPALFGAPDHPPRAALAAVSPLRPRGTGRGRLPGTAATSTWCRSATARNGSNARWRRRSRRRASPASIATARARRARSRRCATTSRPTALDILVGTQMLAKGHDFPRLTLVGVLGADNALYSADFRATERLCALLMQVAGRAGRADLRRRGDRADRLSRASGVRRTGRARLRRSSRPALLREREAAGLPPFSHAAVLAAEAHQRSLTDAFLHDAHALGVALAASDHPDVEVLGVVPALLARRAGFERGQLVVQSMRRPALQRFLPEWRQAIAAASARRVRWSIDVDPAGFG